jgi:2-oxoisovalerate dehydrogenase E1 component
MKGLMKAAYLDPNPVVMLEHKGLYWSKIKGTEDAKTIEPAEDYVLPFGKARTVIEASEESESTLAVITYGMGVYWAQTAAKRFPGRVEILDLRTLVPMDEAMVFEAVKKCGRCLVLTEEPTERGFAQSIAGLVSEHCFMHLDAPVRTLGSEDTPAIPLNSVLEAAALPNASKVENVIEEILNF